MTKFWVTEVGMVTYDYIIDADSPEAAQKILEDAKPGEIKWEDRREDELVVLDNVVPVEDS